MQIDDLQFYELSRVKAHIEHLLKDFDKKADGIHELSGERSIHYFDGEEFLNLKDFLKISFSSISKKKF